MFLRTYGPDDKWMERAGWSEARKEMVRGKREIMPVRVRIFDGVDAEWDALKIERTSEGEDGYVV